MNNQATSLGLSRYRPPYMAAAAIPNSITLYKLTKSGFGQWCRITAEFCEDASQLPASDVMVIAMIMANRVSACPEPIAPPNFPYVNEQQFDKLAQNAKAYFEATTFLLFPKETTHG